MNDARLIERLSATNAHRAEAPLPSEVWTAGMALQELERRMQMQTQERPTITQAPEPPTRRNLVLAATVIVVFVVAFIAATVFITGGDDEPDVIETPTPTTVAATAPTTVPTTVPATVPTTVPAAEPAVSGPPVVEITATNDGYEGIPDVIEAGTRLQLVNASTDAFHAALIIRLLANDDRTLEELAALDVYDIVDPVGDNFKIGVEQALLGAAPGQEGYAMPFGSPVVFNPGRYVVLDLFPVGLDPVEAEERANCCPPTRDQLEGTIPYFQAGLIAEFTVEE